MICAADPAWQPLPAPESAILYRRTLPFALPPAQILAQLLTGIAWRSESIVVWGKRYPQPRLIAWYGDAGKRYTYSHTALEPLPWTDLLLALKCAVEHAARWTFNSVLLNYYRDGRDGMGMHSDDEPELGPAPTIASLSFGATRTFVLRHKRRKDLEPIRLPVESASLLLMTGGTQDNWKHGIVKTRRDCGPRVNLTFRRII